MAPPAGAGDSGSDAPFETSVVSGFEDRRERAHAVRRPPNEKVAAATSISHGNRRMKLSSDVRTSSNPPRTPPTRLTRPRRSIQARDREISSRYASALASEAGHIAKVEVALAE